jgi:hypothetical protein
VLVTGLVAVSGLATAAVAARELGVGRIEKSVYQSALTQPPCCQTVDGLSVDPIASALPGTLILRSEGWRISNLDSDALIINRVSINGEHVAPIGCGSCGHVKRADWRTYPITVESGASVRIFGYEVGDRSSYRKPVKYLVIETDRGTFRYSPDAGVEAQ